MNDEAYSQLVVKIGKKLIELRKQRGYTSHEEFAHAFDLPRYQYWRLEKGKANFTIKTLMKVLSIHRLTPEEFFIALQNTPIAPRQDQRVIV